MWDTSQTLAVRNSCADRSAFGKAFYGRGREWRVPRSAAGNVAASEGSAPDIAASRSAASVTVRAIGPAVSWLWAIGTMPVRLTSPSVGLMPTSELTCEGETIDPSVSVPTAIVARLAATAAAELRIKRDLDEVEVHLARCQSHEVWRPGLPSAYDLMLVEVKKPDESKYPWDYYKILTKISGDDAFGPPDPACPMLKK